METGKQEAQNSSRNESDAVFRVREITGGLANRNSTMQKRIGKEWGYKAGEAYLVGHVAGRKTWTFRSSTRFKYIAPYFLARALRILFPLQLHGYQTTLLAVSSQRAQPFHRLLLSSCVPPLPIPLTATHVHIFLINFFLLPAESVIQMEQVCLLNCGYINSRKRNCDYVHPLGLLVAAFQLLVMGFKEQIFGRNQG